MTSSIQSHKSVVNLLILCTETNSSNYRHTDTIEKFVRAILHSNINKIRSNFFTVASVMGKIKRLSEIVTLLVYFAGISFDVCNGNPSDNQPRIVIVGAGAAGIAAASRLLDNGFKNVIILEAENRIGGRIHTTQFGW